MRVHPSRGGGLRGLETRGNTFLLKCTTASTARTAVGPPPYLGEAEPPVPHKGPGTASYHLGPFPRLRPCVAWQGSKEMGGHPATQLRRLCPGDVRASGGSVLLVPVITLCTGDLEECVRGVRETAELQMSSVAPLRQRDLELYVIINKATWLKY